MTALIMCAILLSTFGGIKSKDREENAMSGCVSCAESDDRPVVANCIECNAGMCVGHIYECRKCEQPMCNSCWKKRGKDLCRTCSG